MTECPFKGICLFSSQGMPEPTKACGLTDLVEYCRPSFKPIKGKHCSGCGAEGKICYEINENTRVCLNCLGTFQLPRLAQQVGVGIELANKILARIERGLP